MAALLEEEDAHYVLIGTMAMQPWGTTRVTRDIDILIEPTVENAGRVLGALSNLGLGLAREWLAEDIAAKPVTVIGDMPRVDIFTLAWSAPLGTRCGPSGGEPARRLLAWVARKPRRACGVPRTHATARPTPWQDYLSSPA